MLSLSGTLRGSLGAPRITVLALILVLGCSKPLRKRECQRLLARYTELLVTSEQRFAKPTDVERAKTQAVRIAKKDRSYELRTCSRSVRRSQYRCAMAAPHVDAFEICLTL